MLDQRERQPNSLSGQGPAASKSDPAQFSEALLSYPDARCEGLKIPIKTDEDRIVYLSDCRNERIGRAGRKNVTKADDLVTGFFQCPAYRIRNAVVGKEFKTGPLSH